MLEALIRKLPWEEGRQGTGYNKIRLFESRKFRCDGYLLYYPEGSEIPTHTDPVQAGRHYRFNFMLKKARNGGEFVCENPIYKGWRCFLIRPDASPHAVTKITDGYRVMLSLGWVR